MQVSIPVRKTITESVDLPQLPYYTCRHGMFYMINEKQQLLYTQRTQITVWDTGDTYYGENLVDALKGNPCSKEEWEAAFNNTLAKFESFVNPASGQSGINNMLDPNQQQPANEQAIAEQATDGVAATEQNAQENALGVNSEEGSTEG